MVRDDADKITIGPLRRHVAPGELNDGADREDMLRCSPYPATSTVPARWCPGTVRRGQTGRILERLANASRSMST